MLLIGQQHSTLWDQQISSQSAASISNKIDLHSCKSNFNNKLKHEIILLVLQQAKISASMEVENV